MDTEIRVDRRLDGAVGRHQLDHFTLPDVQLASGVGMEFDPALPSDLGYWIGILQQPRLVGTAAVVEHGRGIRRKDQVSLAVEGRALVAHVPGAWGQPHNVPNRRFVKQPAAGEGFGPEHPEITPTTLPADGAPAVLEVNLEGSGVELSQRAADGAGHLQQHVAGGLPVPHRHHHRLQ